MSEAWVNANFTICYLTEQFRQTDNKLNDILNEIRLNDVNEFSLELLQGTYNNELKQDNTRLYTHNADVDNINNEKDICADADDNLKSENWNLVAFAPYDHAGDLEMYTHS